jgi:predicted phosphodiesterase
LKLAVIADVHANLAALEAVMVAIANARADRVLCLGDLVGYHAEPNECVHRVREVAHVTVMGNHDQAALGTDPGLGTHALARQVLHWTRARLDAPAQRYLASLPRCWVDGSGVVLAHGCYLNDTHHVGYTTPSTLEANLRAVADRPEWPILALCGHTHVPMCGWLADAQCEHHRMDYAVRWPASAKAVLINPGSVGQPRDGDPRAAFAIIDLPKRRVEVHRVSYDIGRTVDALRRAHLPPELATRLWHGR